MEDQQQDQHQDQHLDQGAAGMEQQPGQDAAGVEHSPPSPQEGQQAATTLAGASRFKAVQFDQAGSTTALATICGKELAENAKRLPVDLVVVCDRSGSMQGQKLSRCKETCAFIVDELKEGDRFGLVSFDSLVHRDLDLVEISEHSRKAALAAIAGIHAGSATNLSGGLFEGLNMFAASKAPSSDAKANAENVRSFSNSARNVVSWIAGMAQGSDKEKTSATGETRLRAVLLLTDGQANHGIRDAEKLVKIAQQLSSEVGGVKICCFGYGSDTNPTMLRALAECSSGTYFFVDEDCSVVEAFADCIGGITSVVAQSLSLRIEPAGGSTLSGPPQTKFPFTKDGSAFVITIPDLYAGESKNVPVPVTVPAITSPCPGPDDAPLVRFELSFIDCIEGKREKLETVVCVSRPAQLSAKEQTAGEDPDVLVHVLRFQTVQVIQDAAREANANRLKAGVDRLREAQLCMHQSSPTMATASAKTRSLYQDLTGDLEKVVENIGSRSLWLKQGVHYATKTSQAYGEERSSSHNITAEPSRYRTVTQQRWVERFKTPK